MIFRFATLLFAAAACNRAVAQEATGEAARPLRSDSRAQYVHRITLYDATGVAIDPTRASAPPYSPRATCGKCHEVGLIGHGWHFNAGEGGPSGRTGEPWILTEGNAGIQAPISYRDWPGLLKPAALGLSEWDFTLRFGRHLPGGGVAHPDQPAAGERWGISGGAEIDCLVCHSADQQHDPAEAERQFERENLRWAPTAAYGLATIRGDAMKLPDDFDPDAPPNPDYPDLLPPRVGYNRTLFDGDNRVFFNITRRPTADRCNFCHSVQTVDAGGLGESSAPAPRDVHEAAGMSCTDCHSNGVDHMITRGYEGEAEERRQPALAAFTCVGCHLPDLSSPRNMDAPPLAARQAPRPLHRGLPPIHFEKLTCTACHSGPWPEAYAHRSQTAFAHGLGVPTRARTVESAPEILAPILTRDARGKIAPHRLVWPAYWATQEDGQRRPIPVAVVRKALGLKESGSLEPLREFNEGELLEAIEKLMRETKTRGQVVYLARGQVHHAEGQTIVSGPDPAADAVTWPLAHDVRPASQSLGIRGCGDCHADDAPFFAGNLGTAEDAASGAGRVISEYRGDDLRFARAFHWAIAGRAAFKLAATAGLVVIGLAALRNLVWVMTPNGRRG